MRRMLAFLGLVCGSSAFAQDVVVENVTVIASSSRPALANANVLLREGRIADIRTTPIAAPTGTVRLDGRGKFLTPGLMDSHVHLSHTAGLPLAAVDSSKRAQEMRDAYFRQQPRNYLYFGVTQVLDLVNTAEGLATFKAQPLHPDLYHCGQAPVIDGYGVETWLDKSIRYKDNPNYLFEPANAHEHPMPEGADPKEHTPEAVVKRIAESGAMCVKVFIENGFGPSTALPLISNPTLQRVRAEAHKRNLLVVAHANAIDMLRIAVANDVDVVAHGTWNWLEMDNKPGVPDGIAEQLREVHRKKIGFQPTMQVITGLGALFDPATLDDPLYRKVVPSEVLAWYRTDDGKWFKNMERQYSPKSTDAQLLKIYTSIGTQGARALKYLYDLGHPILLGSDTPAAPTYGNQPGYNTYREIQSMARAGLPPRAIFDAGTINNARQFRLEKDYGSIEKGKIANLLLLQANPLDSAEAWGRIDKVILRGKVIERETLAAH
jgi:Amidohydrolase family